MTRRYDRCMEIRTRIALIAHDNCKPGMIHWARYNRGTLERHALFATGTTGALLRSELGLVVTPYLSGPLAATSRSVRPSPRDVWIS